MVVKYHVFGPSSKQRAIDVSPWRNFSSLSLSLPVITGFRFKLIRFQLNAPSNGYKIEINLHITNQQVILKTYNMGHGGQKGALQEEIGSLEIRKDPKFSPFLSDEFDPSSFASNALRNTQTTPSAQVDKLQQGISVLDHHLRRLVLDHRDGLLHHASRADDIDASVQRINLSVKSLQSVVARVRSDVVTPCVDAQRKTRQLRNIQQTVDILRQILHRLKIIQRLRGEMESIANKSSDILEVGKAARLLSDIATIDREINVPGIEIMEKDEEFIKEARSKIRNIIDVKLQGGLETLSQADVGSSLQALFNLGELESAVSSYITSEVTNLSREFSSCLDARKLSTATSELPASGAGGGMRSMVGVFQGTPTTRLQDILWERLEKAFESLWRSSVAVWHLQRVLIRKKDPISHQALIHTIIGANKSSVDFEERAKGSGLEPAIRTEKDKEQMDRIPKSMPLEDFWNKTTSSLLECFEAAVGGSHRTGVVLDILTSNYPRLAALIGQTCSRIARDGASRSVPPALSDFQADAIMETVKNIESIWVEKMQNRLTGSAFATFPGGQKPLPSAAEVQSFIAKLSEELKGGVEAGDRLAVMTAVISGSALQAAAERAELMTSGVPEARASHRGCTSAQVRNINICNAMHEIQRSVVSLSGRIPESAVAALAGPLQAIQAVAFDSISPLFQSLVEECQDTMLKIHGLNFGADEAAESLIVETSPPIRDVIQKLSHYRREYFSRFNPPVGAAAVNDAVSVPRALAERMGSRLIVYFVRQASLIYPLSKPGKLQLAKDGSELEAAILQNLAPAEKLQEPLARLRTFLKVLFMEANDIPGNLRVTEESKVVIMLHLFSRVSKEVMPSPLDRAKLRPVQYSLWMDDHPADDIMKQVKAALESSEATATSTIEGRPVVAALHRLLTM